VLLLWTFVANCRRVPLTEWQDDTENGTLGLYVVSDATV